MLDENVLAARIREEAAIALVQLDLAQRIIEVASKLNGKRYTLMTKRMFTRDLAGLLPGWEVITTDTSTGNILFWHPKLLPFASRIIVDIRPSPMGQFDYMDIMVRQLGPYLLGKKKAMELNAIIASLPQLVNAHADAEHKLEEARKAFGVARDLLPTVSVP